LLKSNADAILAS